MSNNEAHSQDDERDLEDSSDEDDSPDENSEYTASHEPVPNRLISPERLQCENPRIALKFLRGLPQADRRMIKHLRFTPDALTLADWESFEYWDPLRSYVHQEMCLESLTVYVPGELSAKVTIQRKTARVGRKDFDWTALKVLAGGLRQGAFVRLRLLYPVVYDSIASVEALEAVRHVSRPRTGHEEGETPVIVAKLAGNEPGEVGTIIIFERTESELRPY
ncbi:hypothetical protein K432DRAFT_401683 [Lepidopterella palustris CBS 459.81]|uniref:Uncharacterized protein n=1 Tax=Lepidopterella palustris CBS 459.81 TaxID=1314670 RepID=A0A8E2EGZ7_9PEZI|nr:hypothetical protein K432DRAFT_401683 [Lepidopterella palustris CBS 459.81]